jgi:hypothetical protein
MVYTRLPLFRNINLEVNASLRSLKTADPITHSHNTIYIPEHNHPAQFGSGAPERTEW